MYPFLVLYYSQISKSYPGKCSDHGVPSCLSFRSVPHSPSANYIFTLRGCEGGLARGILDEAFHVIDKHESISNYVGRNSQVSMKYHRNESSI